jgi:hypothetical protein
MGRQAYPAAKQVISGATVARLKAVDELTSVQRRRKKIGELLYDEEQLPFLASLMSARRSHGRGVLPLEVGARRDPSPGARGLDARPDRCPLGLHAAPDVVRVGHVWHLHLWCVSQSPVLVQRKFDIGAWLPSRPVLKSREHRVALDKRTLGLWNKDSGDTVSGQLREPFPLKAFDPDLRWRRYCTRGCKRTGHFV